MTENTDGLTEQERQQLTDINDRMRKMVTLLEDKTKYTTIQELFNIVKLKMITELTKQEVDTLTKFFTYAHSQKLLYGISDKDDAIDLITKMSDEFRVNKISLRRKSRTEVKDILKDSYDVVRSSFGRLSGARQ